MIKGGRIPLEKVPMIDFGFLSMPSLAGKDISQAFPEALKQYSPKARASLTHNLSFNSDGLAQFSNSFALVFLNQKNLLPEEEYMLSLSQFGNAFNSNQDSNQDFFKGIYQDTGIILRTSGDSIKRNNYAAKNLFNKLSKKGFTASPEAPVVISLTDLRLRQDARSGYGLVWDLNEDATPVIAPEYGTRESVKRFDRYDERGIPIPNEGGRFAIWKRNTGLSRVCSYGDGGASSSGVRLADSGSGGKVTVGGSGIVPQNYAKIEKLISQEEDRRGQVKKELEDRVAKL